MPQAPNQNSRRRTPFFSMAEQLYPEDKQSDAMADNVEDERDLADGSFDDVEDDEADFGDGTPHTLGHSLAQALENTLAAHWKSRPGHPRPPSGIGDESIQASDKGKAPARNDAPANGDGLTRNMLGIVLRLGGMSTTPELGSRSEARLAEVHAGLDQELVSARKANGGKLSPEEEQNLALGYAARVLKQDARTESYEECDKVGGSRSWRNNNPGNIEYRGQADAVGVEKAGRFAKFATPEAGMNALKKLLATKPVGLQVGKMVEAIKRQEGWIEGVVRK